MKMLWGLLAQFKTSEDLLHAARSAYGDGYRRLDAYSPFPVPDLARSIGFRKNGVALVCLVGGLLGGSAIYILQYWINVIEYPINVGGRPLHSWPSFIPPTFEMTVLFAGFGAFFGMWALNGLPMPFHPLFNSKRFASVTRDGFFLSIEAKDAKFELQTTRDFLLSLNATSVEEVPYR
ncbi:MAG TPA: DUF3341 domain-containing protein [Verrucomicrobiae bacterium]|jgi:hypothetical protein|nr:DUF3341 domain-containing protein [Verrucomicrobiae bacterium]